MKTQHIILEQNNVQPNPAAENIWYRHFEKIGNPSRLKCLYSFIKIKDFQIHLSAFTSSDIEGYSSVIYYNGQTLFWRDLQTGLYFKAKNIQSAEKQAMEWFRQVCVYPLSLTDKSEIEWVKRTKTAVSFGRSLDDYFSDC